MELSAINSPRDCIAAQCSMILLLSYQCDLVRLHFTRADSVNSSPAKSAERMSDASRFRSVRHSPVAQVRCRFQVLHPRTGTFQRECQSTTCNRQTDFGIVRRAAVTPAWSAALRRLGSPENCWTVSRAYEPRFPPRSVSVQRRPSDVTRQQHTQHSSAYRAHLLPIARAISKNIINNIQNK